MNEISILKLDDLRELDDFIDATNDKAMTVKGLVVASDGDIKLISEDIKELKQREDILKIAEGKLIKLAGIDRVGFTIENCREQRLLANQNVKNAKQEIKNKALDFFIEKASELINNSKASSFYKKNLDVEQIASDTISGRSKGFTELMKVKLKELESGLDSNAKETTERLAIINNYDYDLTHDKDYLVQLPDDVLKTTLDERKNNKKAQIEREAQKLAEQNESDKIDQEIDGQIEDESEAEAEFERLKAETSPDLLPQLGDFEKDAMRYRHLRSKNIDLIEELVKKGGGGVFAGQVPENLILSKKELDEAIDNEMKLMEKA